MENKIIKEMSYQATNANLLHNWYFVNPINQRNITSTYDWKAWTVGLDRWHLGNLAGNNGGAYWRNSSIEFTDTNSYLYQTLPYSTQEIVGKQLTVSLLSTDGELITGTGTLVWGKSNSIGTPNCLLTYFGSDDKYMEFAFTKINAVAVKLEFGDHQTLAHEVDGHWELNEIPDYTEELIKCQRFFRTCYCVPVVSQQAPYVFMGYTCPQMFQQPYSLSIERICGADGIELAGWTLEKWFIAPDTLVFLKFNDSFNANVAYVYNVVINAEI